VSTISKLKRWSINYYIDTAAAAEQAAKDLARAGGGLGEYYSERETRTPVWLLAGDTRTVATLVGLTDVQRAGSTPAGLTSSSRTTPPAGLVLMATFDLGTAVGVQHDAQRTDRIAVRAVVDVHPSPVGFD
jgi:hypothetical protein